MREPQTWCDEGLLEDEPFLSAFKGCRIVGPPTQCTGKDDDASRNAAIENDIKHRNLLNIVQSWLDLAFPRPNVDGGPTRTRVKADEPGMLNLFVRFYRALSQHFKLAIDVLDKERRRRGLADIRTQQGASLTSTVDSLKVKTADTKQKRIKNNLADEKIIARHPQCGKISDKVNGALLGDSPSKEAKVGGKPAGLQSNKILNAKMDVPGYPKREERFSKSCPSYLGPTSGISETQDTCQIQFNSSTTPSQNTPAVCDLPKTKKRRQTTPNTRRVKHRRTNGTASEAGDSQGGLEAHPAKAKLPILEAATKKKPIPPPRPKQANTELRHASNGTVSGQSLVKRTKSRLDSSQKRPNQKNHSSGLEKRGRRLPQDYPPSLDPAQVDAFPSRAKLSVTLATNNPSNRGKWAATSRTTQGKQGHGVASNKKVIGTNNVPDGPTSDQLLDVIKKSRIPAGLHFKRISKPETSQTKGKLQHGPPVLDSRNNESPEGYTSVPHIDGSVLQSSSNQFNTLAICAPSNSLKRLSSSFDTLALEEGNTTIASKESHGGTKRRKIVQEESTAESVKDTADPVRKQFRGKGKRVKERKPLKVESSERPSIQSETHPATDRPPTNDRLFHQPQQDGMASNLRSHASSSEDRQHLRQEVAVDQKDSVPITAQPDPVKMRRDSPPKMQGFAMQVASAKKGKGRPPKSRVLSSTLTQLNAEMAVPFTGQNVDIKQEQSISSNIPFPPAQRHGVPCSEETVEELSRPINIPRSELDRDMKEESIRSSENRLLTQEHGLVEDHPGDILPTQKPPLAVKPPIWAQSRQEVCETFDWFRSYQGGVYFAHNMVKGYLLSAFSSKRDRFEHGGRLIISHGGGKAESLHTRKGQATAQPATDQLAKDKSVRALLDNYRNQRPLVLLIDDKYVLFPYDLGVRDMTYVVLGFYTIAHAWAEYQPANNETGRVVRYKFAFRWCDDQGSPWWLTDKEAYLSDLTPPSAPINFIREPASKRCPNKSIMAKKSENIQGAVLCATSPEPRSSVCMLCHMGSPQVYTWSWACLYPDCSRFWMDIEGKFLPNNLEYNSGFLKLMTSLPIPPDFGKLRPDPPPYPSTDGTVTNYAFTRGFHCKSCGRLSCRLKWEKWECMNCGECLEVSRSVYKAKDFWSTLLPIAYKDHFISRISKIDQQPVRGFRHENGMGSIQSFILPDGRGKIHHIQPGTPLGRLEADEIFIEYQQQATAGVLRFRRWPLRSHKCRGALLSNYFSQNSGEPYQYVGGSANTVPFENAPGAVVRARALIQKRLQQALGMDVGFNEVLSAAYMERQKMAFHSDNEIGLGPLVAGLSLGSPALMHFRIHAKHDPLREQKGNLLSFVLRHGDVLVMDGAAIQEYYEHTVIPNNFRIAATARQINPGHA